MRLSEKGGCIQTLIVDQACPTCLQNVPVQIWPYIAACLVLVYVIPRRQGKPPQDLYPVPNGSPHIDGELY